MARRSSWPAGCGSARCATAGSPRSSATATAAGTTSYGPPRRRSPDAAAEAGVMTVTHDLTTAADVQHAVARSRRPSPPAPPRSRPRGGCRATLLDELIGGLLPAAAARQPRRPRRRCPDRDPRDRGARQGRRLGRLDSDDRRRLVGRPHRASPRHVRRALCERPRRDRGRCDRPDGSHRPTADGGYRVTGRWGFASGCEHADWLFGNCIEAVPDEGPEMRIAVFSPDEVVIEDTWTASGLSGTGSHHFRVDDVVVPAERTFSMRTTSRASIDDRAHPGAVALLALQSRPGGRRRARSARRHPRHRREQGAAAGRRAARNEPAVPGRPRDGRHGAARRPLSHLRVRRADVGDRRGWPRVHVAATGETAGGRGVGHRRAPSVVETAYRAGGGTAIYAECALQRRLRDVHAVTQHFLVRRDTLVTAGAILAGQSPEIMVF